MMRALYSAADAERELGIRASTVRSWARRQLIFSFGLNRRRDPLYDKRDLVRLRSRMRVRVAGPASRHLGIICIVCNAPAQVGAPVDLCWEHILDVHRFVIREMRDGRSEAGLPALEWPPSYVPKPVVYYVRVGDVIKIGTTKQPPAKRFSDMPIDRQLLAIEPGDADLERARHEQFSDERIAINREWFNPSPRLWRHIEGIRDRFGPPDGDSHPLAS